MERRALLSVSLDTCRSQQMLTILAKVSVHKELFPVEGVRTSRVGKIQVHFEGIEGGRIRGNRVVYTGRVDECCEWGCRLDLICLTSDCRLLAVRCTAVGAEAERARALTW